MGNDSLATFRKVLWLIVAAVALVFVVQAADLWALQALSLNGKPPAQQATHSPPSEVGASLATTGSGSSTYLPVAEEAAGKPSASTDASGVPNFALVGDGGELGEKARAVVAKSMPVVLGTRTDDVVYVNLAEVARRFEGELRWQAGTAQALLITQDSVIRLIPGSKQAEVNLTPMQLSAVPAEINGKLMMPVRALCQVLGTEPKWSQKRRIFSIEKDDRVLNIVARQDIFQLEVSRSQRRLQVYVLGEPVKSYAMCVGRGNNTPVGHFYIQRRAVWPPWTTYEGKYIPGGSRRNPLGARWLGTSARGRERGWAIGMHGTNQPSSIGRRISGGCLRMYNKNAIELYNNIPIGTPVWIHEEPIVLPGAH